MFDINEAKIRKQVAHYPDDLKHLASEMMTIDEVMRRYHLPEDLRDAVAGMIHKEQGDN